VRDETVVSAAAEKDRKGITIASKSSSRSGDMTVALEVTARQAAALQLAMERGTLGLAMRNPLDKNLNPTEPLIVKEGQLTASSEAMDPQTLLLFNQLQQMLGNRAPADANSAAPAAEPYPAGRITAAAPPALPASFMPLSSRRSAWQISVIRGQKVEETELKLKDSENEPADANEVQANGKQESE